jgi:hypothetical protein
VPLAAAVWPPRSGGRENWPPGLLRKADGKKFGGVSILARMSGSGTIRQGPSMHEMEGPA